MALSSDHTSVNRTDSSQTQRSNYDKSIVITITDISSLIRSFFNSTFNKMHTSFIEPCLSHFVIVMKIARTHGKKKVSGNPFFVFPLINTMGMPFIHLSFCVHHLSSSWQLEISTRRHIILTWSNIRWKGIVSYGFHNKFIEIHWNVNLIGSFSIIQLIWHFTRDFPNRHHIFT